MRLLIRNLIVFFSLAGVCGAADVPQQRPQTTRADGKSQSTYYWQAKSIDGTAQLLTLFCRDCGMGPTNENVPLGSILRDTLGDEDPQNDRITYVWLLSCTHLNFGQRLLSAVPFFYWRVGSGSKSAQSTAPLLDLNTPAHPVLSGITQDLLQWTVLDPMITPVRASTRAYRTNADDYERVHLEEAIGYLRQAPVSNDSSAPTQQELDTVIARLDLRKRLLGGLVPDRRAAHIGTEVGFEQERIRSKNWELLRQCAERTGLLFEPLSLAGASDQYAILWFRLNAPLPAKGVALGPVWKLLNIKDPWNDERLHPWRGETYSRSIDRNGSLVSADTPGATEVQLVPLAIYSFNYPKLPLLLVDFRDKLHVRRHEMTQRAINEVTSGVIGISHFTNWYYYVGADLYDFVVSRHGAAMDHAARLDSYAQFRVALALDHSLGADLRSDIQSRIHSLDMNPLAARPDRDIQVATQRFDRLQEEANIDGRLESRIDKDRRAELAAFGESRKARVLNVLVHDATFGLYTRRASKDDTNLAALDRDRRIEYQLSFLHSLVQAGTPPEVAYDSSLIKASVDELSGLMLDVNAPLVRAHVSATLGQLASISHDLELQNDCALAVAALEHPVEPLRAPSAPGVVASAAAMSK